MECYRNVILGWNNVQLFSMGIFGLKVDGFVGPMVPGKHPLNSFDQGQTIRSGHLKHVSSFRGAPNDILIWKIINNPTPTTSHATSWGMCRLVDLKEPLIRRAVLKCSGEARAWQLRLFLMLPKAHTLQTLHMYNIGQFLYITWVPNSLLKSISKSLNNGFS